MQVSEIAKIIEQAFPLCDAEEWDNAGLLLGRRDKDVQKVLLTLDVTSFVAEEAVKCGADMIVSHHPILFSPANRITDETPEGRMILKLIQNDIAVYAAHTNLDKGIGGINDYLSEVFGLKNVETVIKSDREGVGLGRIGILPESMTVRELALLVKDKLSTPVRLSGDGDKMVKKLAIGSGASDDIIPTAGAMGADAVITGDCKYHRNQGFAELGVAVIDAGHYPTEICSVEIFEKLLAGNGLEFIRSENKDIFEFI